MLAGNGRRAEMVVASDSEYVCKGVTEWMPKWKVGVPIFSTLLPHTSEPFQGKRMA
jgi:ribonuclease HI